MFYIEPTQEQHGFAKDLVLRCNYGRRGRADGDSRMQEVGMLGQTCILDLGGLPRPEISDGFDGGFDLTLNNKRVDVKTMGRTVDMKEHYVHNFIGYQMKYDCEYYIFLSYNYTNNKLFFCGVVSKDEFLEKSKFYAKGTKRFRDDGTYFYSKAPLYEIGQNDLKQVYSLQDVLNNIK